MSETKKQKVLKALGTMAHNRSFTTAELSEYAGVQASGFVRGWLQRGLLEKTGREGNANLYFPTGELWLMIEGAVG